MTVRIENILRITLTILLFVLLESNISYGQEYQYVKPELNYYLGFGIEGPRVSIGKSHNDSFYHELTFQYNLIKWSQNEDVIDNPTSGGYYINYDWFLNMFSESYLKFNVGFGFSQHNEVTGKNTMQNLEGYRRAWDLHGGVRLYIIERLSLNAWIVYPIIQNTSNSIITQLGLDELEDEKVLITGSVDLIFRLN